jgi:HipA-like protein
MKTIEIRTVNVVQYKQALREGGSLPAIVKADDDFNYVLKFRGAGQGKKALIAELIGAELARAIGLNVPEIVFMNLDESFSKTEPDEEIQDLLDFSVGLNLGMHYLSSAITYDPLVPRVDYLTASKIVILDSMISNIDRTAKNTNLLIWDKRLWLIDHGAAFYFHHNWDTWKDHLNRTFPFVKNHTLLRMAKQLKEAAEEIKKLLTVEKIREIISVIPEEWLEDKNYSISTDVMRKAYIEFLISRFNKIDTLVEEAENAR